MMKTKSVFVHEILGYLFLCLGRVQAQPLFDIDLKLSKPLEIQDRRVGFKGLARIFHGMGDVFQLTGLASEERHSPFIPQKQ